MKGCVLNKLTIICLLIVLGGFIFLAYIILPKPDYPESERYGTYYNPYHDIYMGFRDDPQNDEYQYILFSHNKDSLEVGKADFIKAKKNRTAEFSVLFFNDSIGRTIIHCSKEDCSIIDIHPYKYVIDTISPERNRYYKYNPKTGYYELNVHPYSALQSLGGFVSLSYNNSDDTPLCSIRK